ncbi:LysR family transcriptional regulator [Streptomyces sp. NPDC101455]|uniref:LysR family transcriptional regulator n=1 Tax=Streptomyces sp. NPDC101455 TaxID=3366142 RepID=UPI0037F575AC
MDLNRVDLNLLVAFDALMSERSVTRAAERLGIGQSAMSSTLGRLRRLLGDPLLVREGRALVATPLAESLELPVREALARLQIILSCGRTFDPSTEHRTFTVVASDYVGVTFLHPLLVRLEADAPHVRLHVRPVPEKLASELHRKQTDLAIVSRDVFPAYRDYRHTVLFREKWMCVVDANSTDLGDTISLDEFSGLPYVATSTGSLPSSVEVQLDLLGIDRQIDITAPFSVVPELLRGTGRIALLPQKLAENAARLANLSVLEPPMPLPPIIQTMIWTAANDGDPGHQWLRQRLSELAEAPQGAATSQSSTASMSDMEE